MNVHAMPTPQYPEPYVTINELAAIMGVSRSTIKRWKLAGMPCETWGARTVRFRPSQAMAWARARRLTDGS